MRMSEGKYRMSEPEIRSVDLLLSVAKDTPNVNIIMLTNEAIKVRVQGESRRWYQIESQYHSSETDIFMAGPTEWSLSVTAGRWQNDVAVENNYSVSLCLHSKNQNLPIGDRIVSLVLALYNDIKTALKIPMLAQFIVCHRDMLKEIVIFQDTMIVTEDMIDGGGEEYPGEWEEMDNLEEEEMEMYESFERDVIGVSSNEMAALHQSWEDEIQEFTDLQNQEIENATEKGEKEEQELIDFWGFMTDKVLDK